MHGATIKVVGRPVQTMESVQYWSSFSSMKKCSYPTLEAYRGSGSAAPLILHLGLDKVNNFMPRVAQSV